MSKTDGIEVVERKTKTFGSSGRRKSHHERIEMLLSEAQKAYGLILDSGSNATALHHIGGVIQLGRRLLDDCERDGDR